MPGMGWLSVTDFEAVGEGVTDDTAAIQAALDAAYAAGGGVVVFPPGRTYMVTDFIVVRDRTTVIAYGATVRAGFHARGVLRNFFPDDAFTGYEGHSDIAILGGLWDGNAYNAADGSGLVTSVTNIACFIHCSNITVRDAVFRNCSGAHGLELNAVSGARVEACRFEGFADNTSAQNRLTSEAIELDVARTGSSAIGAFDGTACEDISISRCWFGPSDRLGNWGRAVGSHSIVAGSWYDRITVESCEIVGAYEAGIRAQYWRDSSITDCKIRGTGGPGIHAMTDGGISQPCTGLTIEGNHVRHSGADAGILVAGQSDGQWSDAIVTGNRVWDAAGYGIRADYAPGVMVTGNRVNGSSGGGLLVLESEGAEVATNSVRDSGSNAINIAGSSGCSVTGNTVHGTSANHGIAIGGHVSAGGDSLVQGNLIHRAARAGVRLVSPRCTVTGNQVRKAGAGTDNGVSVASSATGCVVAGNDLTGNGWSPASALALTATTDLDWDGGHTAPGHNLT